jgi:integrase
MPRLSQAVPRYRKHRATGQAIITLNGKDHYLGPHGTKISKHEYDRLVCEWLASGRSISFGASVPETLTIASLLLSYLQFAKSYYGNGSNSEFHRVVRIARPLKKLYGKSPAVEFGPQQFKAVRQTFLDEDCCRTFINSSMRRVTRLFKWGASEGLIPVSVYQTLTVIPGLKRGKSKVREAPPVLPVSPALVDATLPHLPKVVADIARFQRFTGCRPAEACTIRPVDIDRSADVWEYRPRSHKTEHHGHSRVIFVGPQAQAVLLRYLARDPETNCFRPCDSESKRRAVVNAERKTPLSCGNRPGSNRKRQPLRVAGDAYSTGSYGRAVSRACVKAFPVPAELTDPADVQKWIRSHHWSPNQLRHTAATQIRRRFGLEAAQVVLGHATANVTEVTLSAISN